jgi:MFS family permease
MTADFNRLWVGQTVSVFGSLITRAALPFLAAIALQASPSEMAVLSIATLLPGLLFGLFVGVWVDRLARRPLLIATDVLRAIALGVIPLLAFTGLLHVYHLIAIGFVVGTLTAIFDIAYQSYLPSLVPPEKLVAANSRLSASESIAEVSAFGLGGWLYQILGGPLAITVDAATFLFSAVAIGSIRHREERRLDSGARGAAIAEIVDGARFLIGHPILRSFALVRIIHSTGNGILSTIWVLFVTRELGFEPGPLGMIYAVGGVSALLGALLAPRLIARAGIGPAILLGLAFDSIGRGLTPLAVSATLTAVFLLVGQQLLGDAGMTVYQIGEQTLRQTFLPEQVIGRVMSVFLILELGMLIAGSAIGGWIGEMYGVRAAVVASVALTVLATVALGLSPASRIRSA